MGDWISKLFQPRHRMQRPQNIEREWNSGWSYIETPMTSREDDVQRSAAAPRGPDLANSPPGSLQLGTRLPVITNHDIPGMIYCRSVYVTVFNTSQVYDFYCTQPYGMRDTGLVVV